MRNYLRHFFLLVLPFLLLCAIFAWWAEPLYGDLSRIGRLTEHDFGPNATHPTVNVKANGRFQANSDVVVLGDSFTQRNLWQSVLSENTGYTVESFYDRQNCMQNWIESMIAQPSTKIVMVEMVERSLINIFGHGSSCVPTETIPLEVQAGKMSETRPTWPPTFSLSYSISAALNTVEFNLSPKRVMTKNEVANAPLRAGCGLFSNRRNDRILYLTLDRLNQHWSTQDLQEAVANIVRMQKQVEQSGKKFVLIVAPDKLTVYQSCLVNSETTDTTNINDVLIASGVHAPDLQTPFREHIRSIVDLYDPDNTHWSSAGYILAGNEISRYLLGQMRKQH